MPGAIRRMLIVAASLLLLSACASLTGQERVASKSLPDDAVLAASDEAPPPVPRSLPAENVRDSAQESQSSSGLQSEITLGDTTFFDRSRAAQVANVDRSVGEITLNFERADLREVVHFILGEQLGENYLLHPAVTGSVSLQTTRPLPKGSLLSVLENVLRLNGATMVATEDGVYEVLPRQGAMRGNLVPRTVSTGLGLGVNIVPLEFIAATEMVKILEPFLTPEALVRADSVRNLLILSGTSQELARWQETIDIFDVDWLKGMSVGMFVLRNADVKDVAPEFERLTDPNGSSPFAGLFRVIPIERLNALLVTTSQPRYMDEAKAWVERLDRSRDASQARLHIYRMQHVKAEEAADLLTQIYEGESGRSQARPAARLAPGMDAVEVGDAPAGNDAMSPPSSPAVSTQLAGGKSGALAGDVRIVADETNNALLIMASDSDHRLLLDAIAQLDIPRLQVLVHATIVEVSLTDDLQYGLQWYFDNSVGGRYEGQGVLADGAVLARAFPGFNYSIVNNAGEVRAVLSALAQDSLINVLSAPSVMVLDNQKAVIRVGDQVPVRTTESTSVVTDNPVTVTSIAMRDTGVSLEVTPRVNAGGMVQLEIRQEVNDVTRTTSSEIDSPTIQQRLIESSVAVQSGETVVLGGLIRENSSRDQRGVPGLHKLPLIGPLFGTTSNGVRRTELLVLLTPRVASDATESRAITAEFRRRMRGLEQQLRAAGVGQ